MDKYKVKINHRAIRELNAIYDYIAKEKLSPEYAKRQADRIKSAILDLSTFPQSHQERNTGKYAGKGYRQLLIDNYVAVFKMYRLRQMCRKVSEEDYSSSLIRNTIKTGGLQKDSVVLRFFINFVRDIVW